MRLSNSIHLKAYFRLFRQQSLDPVQRHLVDAYSRKCSAQDLTRVLCALTNTIRNRPDAFPRSHPIEETRQEPRKPFRRRVRRGRLSLTVSPTTSSSPGGLTVSGNLTGIAISIDQAPGEWLTPQVPGPSRKRPSNVAELEALPLTRIREWASWVGMPEVWRVHAALRERGALLDRTAWPVRMLPPARSAVDALTPFEYRLKDFPHLQGIAALLAENDSALFDAITRRLQVIVGEALTGSALENAAYALRARLAAGIFLDSVHVIDRNPFLPRSHSIHRCHLLEGEIDGIYGSLCEAEVHPREYDRNPGLTELLLKKVSDLQGWMETDWRDLASLAATLTHILEPDTLLRLHNLLKDSREAAFEALVASAREVQQLVDDTIQALNAGRLALEEIAESIRSGSGAAALRSSLHASQELYFDLSSRLSGRLGRAKQDLRQPSHAVWEAKRGHLTSEIDLLLEALRLRPQLESGMSVRAACVSIEELPALSKRVVCRLIARELRIPH